MTVISIFQKPFEFTAAVYSRLGEISHAATHSHFHFRVCVVGNTKNGLGVLKHAGVLTLVTVGGLNRYLLVQ